jgi:TetR/AcrR family transcriptional regulator
MKMTDFSKRRREHADQTRKRILRAAIREFSTHGLSGARIDAIAESAGTNKALLYYYFKDKKGLYAAAVEEVSERVVENALAALNPEFSAGERLLRTALVHFDRILAQQEFQSLMQQEMVRFRSGQSKSMPLFARKAFKPLLEKLRETIDEGARTGELCKMDWLQVIYSMFGANVFYFLSAPLMQIALPFKPFDINSLKTRRIVAVQFLGNALFTDRVRGVKLANRILADMPMPQVKKFQLWRKYP